MAPRVPPKARAAPLVPTGTKKKDIKKGSSSTTQKVVTRRAAALDELSVTRKGKGLIDDSRENEEQAIESMETEEEGENGGVFTTPRRGNSPQQQGFSSRGSLHVIILYSLKPTCPADFRFAGKSPRSVSPSSAFKAKS